MELIILIVLLAVIAGAIGLATKNSETNGSETSNNVGFDLKVDSPFEKTPSLNTSAKPTRKATKKVSAKVTKETPAVSVKKGKPAKKASAPTPAPAPTSKRAVKKAQPLTEVKATKKGKSGKRK